MEIVSQKRAEKGSGDVDDLSTLRCAGASPGLFGRMTTDLTNNTVVISYELKDWEYCEPESYIDENGKLRSNVVGEKKQIGPITLLYLVEFDNNNNIVHSEPLEAANIYLMYLKIERNLKCTSVSSRALKHFFSFMADENKLRHINNQPELLWDKMPIRESQRPTYRYRKCLEGCYNSDDPQVHLARSTCNSYMNRIVNFYKYYIENNYYFENVPFQYELIPISIPSKYNYMRPQRRIYVHTTDLRLNLGKDLRKRPSPLTALTETEWEAIQKIILITRQVLTMRDGRLILTNLPEEFTWILLLMRWTGMRREEVLTLRTTHFFKPNYQQLLNGYVEIDIGPSTGTNTKFGKDRTIEMPSQLMASIYNYLQSSRYITRRRKYRKIYNEHHFENDFAFISESGENYSLSTLNSRWSDIRRTIEDPKLGLGESFEHKPHNLRATYAVERIINLLDHNISEGKAFRHIQGHLGHENEDTTLHYLTQAQDRRKGRRSPQAVWENIVDYHLQQGLFSKKDSQ